MTAGRIGDRELGRRATNQIRGASRVAQVSAAMIFALGRSAGWVAHALEQRSAGYLLRPRARYVGPPHLV